jgi:hypothetical protein
MVLCGERIAVAFDPSKSVHALLEQAASMIRSESLSMSVMSLGCISTASSLLASNGPRPGSSDRASTESASGS